MPSDRKPLDASDIIASAPAHDHGPTCEHCGTALGVERSYTAIERMSELLLQALCAERGLRLYRKGRGKTLYVRGPDDDALDDLEARVQELLPKLDERLLDVTVEFVHEHTRARLSIRAGT